MIETWPLGFTSSTCCRSAALYTLNYLPVTRYWSESYLHGQREAVNYVVLSESVRIYSSFNQTLLQQPYHMHRDGANVSLLALSLSLCLSSRRELQPTADQSSSGSNNPGTEACFNLDTKRLRRYYENQGHENRQRPDRWPITTAVKRKTSKCC